ncbi:MAG TPA: hypothetical protein VMX74_11360 [Pirellulales bacterium]|nr:hypothetical protein [Pirellulales bacterium]
MPDYDKDLTLPVPCPWPRDIFPMTPMQYADAVPDEVMRTAISGLMSRHGWETLEAIVASAINRSPVKFMKCWCCGEYFFGRDHTDACVMCDEE